MVEHRPFKARVGSSNLPGRTKFGGENLRMIGTVGPITLNLLQLDFRGVSEKAMNVDTQ